MSELVFYTNPMSRGRTVRWMLHEVGADYRTEIVEYGPQMKGPEYRAINPMGKVPAIRHRGMVVTEVAAIVAYLADAFPEAGLAPEPGSPERGPYYRWLFFCAGPLEYAVINTSLGFEVPEDKQGRIGYGTMETVLDTLDAHLQGRDFVAGEQFTAADLMIGGQLGWGMAFGMIPKRPSFEAYAAPIMERPAMKEAMAIDDKALPPQSQTG